MANKKMKSLAIGEDTFEVVDEIARYQLQLLEERVSDVESGKKFEIQEVTVPDVVRDIAKTNAYLNLEGAEVQHSNYRTSDYIEIEPNTPFVYNRLQSIIGYSYVVAFYDVNKDFISGVYAEAANNQEAGSGRILYGECTVPHNAEYFKVCTYFEIVGSISYQVKVEVIEEQEGNTAVLYTDQELTEEQKEQARKNIGSAKSETYEEIRQVSKQFSSVESENAYIDLNGELIAHANYRASSLIVAFPKTKIEYTNCQSINGYSMVVAFYDKEQNFISGIYQKDDADHPGGNGTLLTGECVVPDNASFFRIGTHMHSGSTFAYNAKVEVSDRTANNGKQWLDATWYAFGTSLTDTSYVNAENGEVTGKYVPYLAELSGLNVINHGIAGGTIALGGVHGGSANILAKILATDISTADIITIEGFVNDFACGISLGKPGDIESNTLCGAIYLAVKHCLENSNATVVLLTDSTGRKYTLSTTGNEADYTLPRVNGANLIQNDYNETICKMGQYMGIHVIDAGRKSQINEFSPQYFADHLHHSELGGKQYAETIWEELKTIHVNSAVTI